MYLASLTNNELISYILSKNDLSVLEQTLLARLERCVNEHEDLADMTMIYHTTENTK